MEIDKITRDWYSESKVDSIIVPKLATWRSRYDLKEQLMLEDNNLVIRNMRLLDLVPRRTAQDTRHIVTPRRKL